MMKNKELNEVKVCMFVFNNMVSDSRVLKEANSLSKFGAKVEILALWDKGLKRKNYVDGVIINRVNIMTRRLPKIIPLRSLIVFIEVFLRFLIFGFISNADVYHSHDASPLPVVYLLSVIKKSHFVYDSHELEIARAKTINNKIQKIRIMFEKVFMPKADKMIISDGDARAHVMLEYHGVERSYQVIRNYPLNSGNIENNDMILHNILSISHSTDILLYIGHTHPGRGLEEVIYALEKLPENIVFVVLGKKYPSFVNSLQSLAASLGVNDRLFFLPPVDPGEVVDYAAGAKLSFVLIQNIGLSYYLSTPSKLFESIAAGVPVIASDFPEIRKIVLSNGIGPTGIVVDPSDVSEIVRSTQDILNNHDMWEDFHMNSLRLAENEIKWELEEEKLINLYIDMLYE